jgi:hypothetical protein
MMPTRRRLWCVLDTNDGPAGPLVEPPDGYPGAAYNLARPSLRPQWTMGNAWPVAINPNRPSC